MLMMMIVMVIVDRSDSDGYYHGAWWLSTWTTITTVTTIITIVVSSLHWGWLMNKQSLSPTDILVQLWYHHQLIHMNNQSQPIPTWPTTSDTYHRCDQSWSPLVMWPTTRDAYDHGSVVIPAAAGWSPPPRSLRLPTLLLSCRRLRARCTWDFRPEHEPFSPVVDHGIHTGKSWWMMVKQWFNWWLTMDWLMFQWWTIMLKFC